ncbi:MAG: HAD family hydrolase [Phaeovulum sp.]|uniref:sulfotransferase-like domain-containing protein n=1 Tax=Phaeovulum sp. TaxID=2934796 RepID=UPI002733F46D|nr:HAD family hydrolase [Phaeovulum sp.]MDP3859998.1 HAD family hydrolase [Phaeovulum sp.]
MKIAMWSGPRNLSTALMYSFAARGDCAVADEPFYAAYLAATGLDHPMRAEILVSQPTDPLQVAALCGGPIPHEQSHFYMKHMTHHMIASFPISWAREAVNVFLIRHPARVIASYAKKREGATLDDLGFQRQAELYDEIAGWGTRPIVIDSTDIRAAPAPMLQKLCAAIGLEFTPAMLHWPPGGHPSDGVWAAHWYGVAHRSSGFDTAEGPPPQLSGDYARLVEAALPYYQRLAAHKLG